MEIIGILSSVHHNHLEDSVCKIFDKLNCNIVKDNIEDCRLRKSNRVELSKRKDRKQVLSVKNDLKNTNMADLGFGLIYINQNLCFYYKMLWSLNRKPHIRGRIYSWYVSGGTITIKIHEHGDEYG